MSERFPPQPTPWGVHVEEGMIDEELSTEREMAMAVFPL